MRGRRGLFSLFTSLPEHPEERDNYAMRGRRRRRHSSGDRETWSRKLEYFFASLGYAVGLGNIWRFPYLCYRNGGGAFLIPYFLALCGVGFPMLFLEMSFGQFASLGTITIWRVCPLFKGIGYSIITVLLLVNTYYNVLIAYSLFYLFASVTDKLPWSNCDNQWNTAACIIERYGIGYATLLVLTLLNTYYNVICAYGLFYLFASISDELPWGNCDNVWNTKYCIIVRNDHRMASNGNSTLDMLGNLTTTMASATADDRKLLKTPTEEFFYNHLLKASDGIYNIGSVQWPLIVCLAVSWFTCFMCLFKGIKSMGKVVIFTTLFSYIILTVLFIRGCTLQGAAQGIIYYLKPDFKKLASVQVWGEASAQAFASLTLGGGGWITLSSYNKFNNRCNRDAILVGIGNALTSLYSGFVIFSVLGYMAYIKGVDVEEVTDKGPGLAFVAYPEGLAMIPGAPFWSICFFFMMFTVGLDSLFGQVETMAAGIIDEYPDILRPRRKLFTFFMCLFMFLLGIPLITQAGIYMVTLLDWYTLLFSFTIISLFEIIVIIYIYGYQRFSEDIEMMIGTKPNMYFKIMWIGVSPALLICVIAFLAAKYVPPYHGNYSFPPNAESIGWFFALGPIALIPITMIVQFFRKVGNCTRMRGLFTDEAIRDDIKQGLILPEFEWGPALPEIRRRYSIKHGLPDDDDVFGPPDGAELVGVRTGNGDAAGPPEGQERSPLVKFAPTHDVISEDGAAQAESSTNEKEGKDAEEKA